MGHLIFDHIIQLINIKCDYIKQLSLYMYTSIKGLSINDVIYFPYFTTTIIRYYLLSEITQKYVLSHILLPILHNRQPPLWMTINVNMTFCYNEGQRSTKVQSSFRFLFFVHLNFPNIPLFFKSSKIDFKKPFPIRLAQTLNLH